MVRQKEFRRLTLPPREATSSSHEQFYANDYCWVLTCRDGLVAQVRNFTDTLHADRLFGLDNKTPTAA